MSYQRRVSVVAAVVIVCLLGVADRRAEAYPQRRGVPPGRYYYPRPRVYYPPVYAPPVYYTRPAYYGYYGNYHWATPYPSGVYGRYSYPSVYPGYYPSAWYWWSYYYATPRFSFWMW